MAWFELFCSITLQCKLLSLVLTILLQQKLGCFIYECYAQVDVFSYAMFIFELLTGQLPYESLTTIQEIDQAVVKGERPLINEGNAEPSFPGLMDLMYDCWKHSPSDRPDADEVYNYIIQTFFAWFQLRLQFSIFPWPFCTIMFINTS